MTLSRVVSLPPAPLDPAPLNIRWPLGLPLDLRISFRTAANEKINLTGALHQFVLLPRSRGGQHPYDMTMYDAVNGVMAVSVPGNDLTDDKGYNIEIYSRHENPVPGDPPLPDFMPVKGSIVTYGSAYSSTGPQSMINIPVVVGPPGPPGAQGAPGPEGDPGAPGVRGSVWFTGTGDPSITGVDLVYGDMYLDNASGNVWQWTGSAWVLQ